MYAIRHRLTGNPYDLTILQPVVLVLVVIMAPQQQEKMPGTLRLPRSAIDVIPPIRPGNLFASTTVQSLDLAQVATMELKRQESQQIT